MMSTNAESTKSVQAHKVLPIDGSTQHSTMFEMAETIDEQLSKARHIVKMAALCGYNAAQAHDNHPGSEWLDGDALYNILSLAIDAIEKAESQFEQYRHIEAHRHRGQCAT